jgi:hypothetical protein
MSGMAWSFLSVSSSCGELDIEGGSRSVVLVVSYLASRSLMVQGANLISLRHEKLGFGAMTKQIFLFIFFRVHCLLNMSAEDIPSFGSTISLSAVEVFQVFGLH